MLNLTFTIVGVGLVTIEILIQKFNDGKCSSLASWLAGVYIGIGALNLVNDDVLCAVLCMIPTFSILICNLFRRCEDSVRV